MSHKVFREDGKTSKNLPVASKCLAIVLIPRTRNKDSNVLDANHDPALIDANETLVDPADGNIVQSSEVHRALSPHGYNGKELLHDFKIRNKTCYWNPSLVESIKCLEYKGFVEPSTILVTGADIHLENLRSAWGRRVLKAPAGFGIERIGDVNGIQMQVIPQTQFMPLPDALCSIVLELNNRRVVATLEVILEQLHIWYTDMNMPDHQLVFDTIGSLIKDRKLFHTGSGYFVVTPDTSRLQTSTMTNANSSYMPTNASWLPYHPMYVPVFQGQQGMPTPIQRAHMKSISCQVTTIEDSDESDEEKLEKLRTAPNQNHQQIRRSNSLGRKEHKAEHKAPKMSKDDSFVSDYKRSSIKHKDKGKSKENAKAAPEKEIKEKTSLFSKIFGRHKKKSNNPSTLMPPPPPPPPMPSKHPPAPSVTTNMATSGSESASDSGKGEKEYATFSAQFPPSEWMWYQQQLEKQKRTETWINQQVAGSRTNLDANTRVSARPPTGSSKMNVAGTRKSTASLYHPSGVDYVTMGEVQLQKKSMERHHQFQAEAKFVKPQQPLRPDNFYESSRNPASSKHRHHRKSKDFDYVEEDSRRHHHHRHHHRQSEYDVIDQGDVTPHHDSNVYHSVSGLSPVAHLSDESAYAKLVEQPKLGGPLHSTPRVDGSYRDRPDRRVYGVEGHEARDRIYGPPQNSQKRKSNRTRRRAQRAFSYYNQGDDISYEYKGRLPNKNSSQVQSRDSGVNCVGLGATKQNEDILHSKRTSNNIYENAAVSRQQGNRLPAPSGKLPPHHPPPNHVHFASNKPNETNQTDMSALCVTDPGASIAYQSSVMDPAYNSVVYGSNITDAMGPSVEYHTIANSNMDASEMGRGAPHPSLQSGFYDSSMAGLSPGANVITCQVEINPKAPPAESDLRPNSPVSPEAGYNPHSPGDTREVLGSSQGIVELVGADEETEIVVVDDEEEEEVDEQGDGSDDEDEHLNGEEELSLGDDGRASRLDEKNIPSTRPLTTGGEGGRREVSGASIVSEKFSGEDLAVVEPGPNISLAPPTPKTEASTVTQGVKDIFVSDSGFSSPRNQETPALGRREATSGQSNSEQNTKSVAGGKQNEDQPGKAGNQSDKVESSSSYRYRSREKGVSGSVSDGHHTTSSTGSSGDIHMASGGDQHHSSGSTDRSHIEDQDHQSARVPLQDKEINRVVEDQFPGSPPTRPNSGMPIRMRESHSANFPVSNGRMILSGSYPSQLSSMQFHPSLTNPPSIPVSGTAKLVTHPDVYNNNNNTAHHMYIDASRSNRVPLHPNAMLSNQRPPPSGKVNKRADRPHSDILWKGNAPEKLHRFEEEQLAKKYGANGEFEVMGVL